MCQKSLQVFILFPSSYFRANNYSFLGAFIYKKELSNYFFRYEKFMLNTCVEDMENKDFFISCGKCSNFNNSNSSQLQYKIHNR